MKYEEALEALKKNGAQFMRRLGGRLSCADYLYFENGKLYASSSDFPYTKTDEYFNLSSEDLNTDDWFIDSLPLS